ncbi:MAG: uncharacterized protein A8A55_0141 [Amphiamblys sp. WSBS2006]|nr:MAG: uncharacterized protein A8A55_0141 [Amphiamblys sp. WSBS2006]
METNFGAISEILPRRAAPKTPGDKFSVIRDTACICKEALGRGCLFCSRYDFDETSESDSGHISVEHSVFEFLREIRLHKYLPCFRGLCLADITHMTDSELRQIGVSTAGARKRIMKLLRRDEEC